MKLSQSTFLVRVSLGNDAFSCDGTLELARMLRELADKVESQSMQDMSRFQNMRDVNGNPCGQYAIKPEGYEG